MLIYSVVVYTNIYRLSYSSITATGDTTMNTEANKEESYKRNLLNAHLDRTDMTVEEERELNQLRDEALDELVNKKLRDITDDELADALIRNPGKWRDLASAALKIIENDFDITSRSDCKFLAFSVTVLFRDLKADVAKNTIEDQLP